MEWIQIIAAAVDISPLPETRVTIVKEVIQIVIGVVAAICLLFITVGGLRYVLSQGDSQAIAKAKGTIVYALVGLVVVIIAQLIVTFVIGNLK